MPRVFGPPPRIEESVEPDGPDRARYVTDGRRLFRVVSTLDPLLGEPVELENCQTLEVRRYTSDELLDMRLRRVRVTPDGG